MKRHIGLKVLIALALVPALAMGAPARAGLFDWLTGGPKETAVPASAQVDQTTVTLPPVDALVTEAPAEAPAPATEAPASTPEATPAPIPDATIEDDGLLRVDLRSLDGPQQLHLRLAGVYAVEGDPGFRFERGTELTLSAAEGSVYMYVGGLTLDMGPSMTLTRHRAPEGEENGIYIDESEKDTLYAGDLSVSFQADALRCVLKIGVEDYLYGVVAYEMSDSFPLEALKAQAVAARTYAMQRKRASGKRDYDVVDTTADQVFKGFDGEYVNVIRAVDDTRGVVELYDGTFAICYYTASNGGQTALASQVLGTTDGDACLEVTDDPYDLENPRSLQNELTVSAACEGSAELKGMLEAALGERLAQEGYGEGEWAFSSIASVEPVDPRFEGSRMYDGLKFGLRARLYEPVATPEPTAEPTAAPSVTPEATAEATPGPGDMPVVKDEALPEATEVPRKWVDSDEIWYVTLDVYGQIKDGLSLGLNGLDCELVDVASEADDQGEPKSFTLIMRRYGHGVGMSQRGAQWMAGHYGMNWQQILGFYYPGMAPARMRWPDDALTDLSTLPDSVGAARPRPTPTPTPVPLPPLVEGERYATVTATSLNLRERPTTSSRAIDQLPKGRRLIVSSEPDADGWVSVHTGDAQGFVKAEYLAFE